MEQNKDFTIPIAYGMNRDMHPAELNPAEYIFALNAVTESFNGDTLKASNEPSNLLCTRFKEGFKVIGFKRDLNNNGTYFFITNPETGESEIGYLETTNDIEEDSDIEKFCGCDVKKILSEPLELQQAIESCSYKTLINDSCNKCLNFNINYPILSAELKVEKSEVKIFWTDDYNPPRYINLTRIDNYLFKNNDSCEEDGEVDCQDECPDCEDCKNCVDCEKLKIFKDYQKPCTSNVRVENYGNLSMGRYELFMSYSDEKGREMSQFFRLTSWVNIFDNNQVITDQPSLADKTNKTIVVQLFGVDTAYTHFKVVSAESSNVDGGLTIRTVGIYTTTTEEISYSSNGQIDPSVTEQTLFRKVPKWKKSRGLVANDGQLYQYGLQSKKFYNLQRVVNLMSPFLKWQTHIARENLYSFEDKESLHSGYMRNENYGFSIKFYDTEGDESVLFPFTFRPPTATELEEVVGAEANDDIKSVLDADNNCYQNRTKRWQYYNTAEISGLCGEDLEYEEGGIKITETKSCENTFTVTPHPGWISIIIDAEDDRFDTNNLDFLSQNFHLFLQGGDLSTNVFDHQGNPTTIENYATVNPTVTITTTNINATDTLIVVIDGINYSVEHTGGDTLEDTVDKFITQHGAAILSTQSITVSKATFDTSVLIFSVLFPLPIITVINGTTIGGVYTNGGLPVICEIEEGDCEVKNFEIGAIEYKQGTINGSVPEQVIYTTPTTHNEQPNTSCNKAVQVFDSNGQITKVPYAPLQNVGTLAYERVQPLNESCGSALLLNNNFTAQHHHNGAVIPILSFTDLYDQNITLNNTPWVVGGNSVPDELAKNAIWFKIDFEGKDRKVVEFYPISTCNDTFYTNKSIRFSTFNSCSAVASVESLHQNIENGWFIMLERGNYTQDVIYAAIDLPWVTVTDNTPPNYPQYAIMSLVCDCINLRVVDAVKKLKTSYSTITLKRDVTYEIECEYQVPKISDCEIKPFQEGYFGYYESVDRYPNNKELYDSRDIKVKFDYLTGNERQKFQDVFGNTTEVDAELGQIYKLQDEACLMDKPIRFYKFPDNNLAPFMGTQESLEKQSSSIIFPIGVKIDNDIINIFLDVAKDNGLISEEQRNKINKYEVYRTDRTLHKSIIAKGLLYDTFEYENRNNQKVRYANYPYNCLTDDTLNFRIGTSQNIPHPFNGESNNMFTFHSPDTHFIKPSTNSFSEVYMEGYQFGWASGGFDLVDRHAKQTILGSRAIGLANTLAGLEAGFELFTILGDIWVNGLTGHVITTAAAAATAVLVTVGAVVQSTFKAGKYRYQWLETFYNLRAPQNYAYKYSSEGFYDNLRGFNDEGNLIRAIRISKYLKSTNYTVSSSTEKVLINNTDRESSLFLSTGNFNVQYNNIYRNYDVNNNKKSRFTATEAKICEGGSFDSRIASPYVTIRNFLPSQYGNIDSITWINTGYCGVLSNDNKCEAIFGGDVKISRMSLKRKMPLFLSHMVEMADRTPFAYTLYGNVGQPKFFANFRVLDLEENVSGLNLGFLGTVGSLVFPRERDQYRLDCFEGGTARENVTENKNNKFYYAPKDLKFYLHYYGVPQFLVESEINLNYRYARKEPWEWFYPNGGVGDLNWWTQEFNVPIRYDNEYNYNRTYSRNILIDNQLRLPRNYNKEDWDKMSDFENGVISSEIDRTEVDRTEPWLMYKPFNLYEFSTSLGKLIDIKSIESLKLLARFESQYMIINPIDTLRERIDGYNREIGVGIFQQRPIETIKSELGWAGTQHREIITTEFGRFFVDAMRGQVITIPMGSGAAIDIAAYKRDGKPSGMKRWFREQLPFKILKGGVENLKPTDLDNSYNSVGIAMVWDALYTRLILTKKDYIVRDEYKGKLKFENNTFKIKESNQEVRVDNKEVFEEASFTISYYPTRDSWVSFHSYKPNYYIPYSNYFQSGNNNSTEEENGLWYHMITNKSYQVFYGKKYPFVIEVAKRTKNLNKVFHSYDYYLDVRRYHNKYDHSENTLLNFNKAWVYNKNNNSGNLNLINKEQNNYFQQTQYPKHNSDSVDILVGYSANKWSFNSAFNRVKDQHNNTPIWNYDNVWSDKYLDNRNINYRSGWTERIRGDYYIVRLQQDIDTQHNFIFKWGFTEDNFNI